jgi:hypothetical protein
LEPSQTVGHARIDDGESMSAIPDRQDALLTREVTAAALTEAGFPVKAKTLATKASRGGGPPFRKFSNRPLYVWSAALDWAQSRLGPLVMSTSELDGKNRDLKRSDPSAACSVSAHNFPAHPVGSGG